MIVWQVVLAGYLQRIDLSAHGFYITPDIGFEWDIGKGKPFAYYTFGAAYAETEIDTLTGDFYLRRVDIVMDLGHSLNPAIDIGQVSLMLSTRVTSTVCIGPQDRSFAGDLIHLIGSLREIWSI